MIITEEWSAQQEGALRALKAWLSMPEPTRPKIFRLFGFAGTGKTTIARELQNIVKGKVLYATLTGKASLVLQSKGCNDAGTLHALIYKVSVDEETGEAVFTINRDSDLADAKLLVVDEVSMVDELVGKDVLSFGVDILVLGDPAQLQPVKGAGFFTQHEPDVMLTEVHRQARDNPIIRMSMDVREGCRLVPGVYGSSLIVPRVEIDRDQLRERVLDAGQVICGINRTRITYNSRIRELKGLVSPGYESAPTTRDKLICIKNNRDKHTMNGSMWTVINNQNYGGEHALRVLSLDQIRDPLDILVASEFFHGTESNMDWRVRRGYDEFTFGWVITCHKSQGSQWDNVLIFDESGTFREQRRNWLYTAITRAAEKVTIIQ